MNYNSISEQQGLYLSIRDRHSIIKENDPSEEDDLSKVNSPSNRSPQSAQYSDPQIESKILLEKTENLKKRPSRFSNIQNQEQQYKEDTVIQNQKQIQINSQNNVVQDINKKREIKHKRMNSILKGGQEYIPQNQQSPQRKLRFDSQYIIGQSPKKRIQSIKMDSSNQNIYEKSVIDKQKEIIERQEKSDTNWNILASFPESNVENTVNEYLFFTIPICIFSFDIVRCFNTGYYEDGVLVTNRKQIAKKYIKFHFGLDLLTTTSIMFTKYFSDGTALYFVFLLRSIRLKEIASETTQHFQLEERFPNIFILSRLLFLIIFVAHFAGCGFHFIAQQEMKLGLSTWLHSQKIEQEDWVIRYLNTLYFSVITMITVGYGDIVPVTIPEKLYIIIMTLLSSAVFAYTVNTIGAIFQGLAQKQASFKQQKYDITIYMHGRQIHKSIQLKVLKYLDYLKQKEEEAPDRANIILNNLSISLREEVKRDYYGRILKEQKVFFNNFSEAFIDRLSLQMKEVIYGPGEIIFDQEEYQNIKIYFVAKGEIQTYVKMNNKVQNLEKIHVGALFGSHGFFSQQGRQFAARSETISDIIYLSMSDFMKTLADFPQDQEKYCQIRDEIQFLNKQKIEVFCKGCSAFNHTLTSCHLVHYQKNKQFVIRRHNFSTTQTERRQYERKPRKLYYLIDLDLIRYFAKKIRIDQQPPHIQLYYTRVMENYEDELDLLFYIRNQKIKGHENEIVLESDEGEDDIFLQDELEKQKEEQINFQQSSLSNITDDKCMTPKLSQQNSLIINMMCKLQSGKTDQQQSVRDRRQSTILSNISQEMSFLKSQNSNSLKKQNSIIPKMFNPNISTISSIPQFQMGESKPEAKSFKLCSKSSISSQSYSKSSSSESDSNSSSNSDSNSDSNSSSSDKSKSSQSNSSGSSSSSNNSNSNFDQTLSDSTQDKAGQEKDNKKKKNKNTTSIKSLASIQIRSINEGKFLQQSDCSSPNQWSSQNGEIPSPYKQNSPDDQPSPSYRIRRQSTYQLHPHHPMLRDRKNSIGQFSRITEAQSIDEIPSPDQSYLLLNNNNNFLKKKFNFLNSSKPLDRKSSICDVILEENEIGCKRFTPTESTLGNMPQSEIKSQSAVTEYSERLGTNAPDTEQGYLITKEENKTCEFDSSLSLIDVEKEKENFQGLIKQKSNKSIIKILPPPPDLYSAYGSQSSKNDLSNNKIESSSKMSLTISESKRNSNRGSSHHVKNTQNNNSQTRLCMENRIVRSTKNLAKLANDVNEEQQKLNNTNNQEIQKPIFPLKIEGNLRRYSTCITQGNINKFQMMQQKKKKKNLNNTQHQSFTNTLQNISLSVNSKEQSQQMIGLNRMSTFVTKQGSIPAQISNLQKNSLSNIGVSNPYSSNTQESDKQFNINSIYQQQSDILQGRDEKQLQLMKMQIQIDAILSGLQNGDFNLQLDQVQTQYDIPKGLNPSELYIYDFEKLWEFSDYFFHNNITQILKNKRKQLMQKLNLNTRKQKMVQRRSLKTVQNAIFMSKSRQQQNNKALINS